MVVFLVGWFLVDWFLVNRGAILVLHGNNAFFELCKQILPTRWLSTIKLVGISNHFWLEKRANQVNEVDYLPTDWDR